MPCTRRSVVAGLLLASSFGLCTLSTGPALADEAALHLDPIPGGVHHGEQPPRGTILTWGTEPWESGLIWQWQAVEPPDYGAFAECYSGDWLLLAVVLDLTRVYEDITGGNCDIYVWADGGGLPGAVLHFLPNFAPGTIGLYPDYTRVFADLPAPLPVAGPWWVGFWPIWPGEEARWFLACDHSGDSEACMMTNIAPVLGDTYPIGWQSMEVVWGPHTAIGISALVDPVPTPTLPSTWGKVKALYR